MNGTRAWLYARAQDQNVVDLQFAALEQYAAEHGISVQGRSQDITTAQNFERPGLQEGKQALAGGQAEVLLVVKLSRVARDLQAMLSFIRELEAFGGKVLSTTEGEPDTATLGLIACMPEPDAECVACGELVNLNSDGCTVGELICDGEAYDRVKVGDEADIYTQLTNDGRCPGCFARVGFFHHFGCEFERCPACGNAMNECECEDVEPPDEDDD